MDKKIALITGISGQDGAYLSRLLLEKNYEVHGIIRRSSSFNTWRIDEIFDKIHLHYGDMTDGMSLIKTIDKVRPDEIYNLAAQSHVKVSFELPVYTGMVDAIGPLNLLEAVRIVNPNKIRVYQASSSEMYGGILATPGFQNELTPFNPRSPYAAAKVYAFNISKNYREAYGMHISNGILFNHESPLRHGTFVTKKIVNGIVKIIKEGFGEHSVIELGNLNAIRDWGHAKDYVEAMWLMLQQDKPDDYVIATGETHSVAEFAKKAFSHAGFDLHFSFLGSKDSVTLDGSKNVLIEGKVEAVKWGNHVSEYHTVIRTNKKYLRPTEVDYLCGDASKAYRVLGWKPKITFDKLIEEMVENATG